MHTVVPPDQLAPATLQALIEDFVTRDGAVQGHQDKSLHDQVHAVERALRLGEALLVFDDVEESFTIVPAAQWRRRAASDDDGRTIDRELGT